MRLVTVFWRDATQFLGWFSPEEAKEQEVEPIASVGYLVHQDDKVVILAQTDSDDGTQLCGIFHIPAECVTQIEDL